MDNLFEIVIFISIIWSIFSSLKSKKKKGVQTQTKSTTSDGLFAELEQLLEGKHNWLGTVIANVNAELEQLLEGKHIPQIGISEPVAVSNNEYETSFESPKETSDTVFHEKMGRKQALLPKKPKSNAFDFASPLDHLEHFDSGLDLHSPIQSPSLQTNQIELDSTIDTESLMNPQHIREAILLNEILNKPKSLQHR